VLQRFASVRRTPRAPAPAWIDDAVWIDAALRSSCSEAAPPPAADPMEPCAFEHLLTPVVDEADARLWSSVAAQTAGIFTDVAHASLRHSLLQQLSELCAPALYALFDRRHCSPPAAAKRRRAVEAVAAGEPAAAQVLRFSENQCRQLSGVREDGFDSGADCRPEDFVGRVAGYRKSHSDAFMGGDYGRQRVGLSRGAEDQFDCVQHSVVEVSVVASLEFVELVVGDL